jgi:hypothetical protein
VHKHDSKENDYATYSLIKHFDSPALNKSCTIFSSAAKMEYRTVRSDPLTSQHSWRG